MRSMRSSIKGLVLALGIVLAPGVAGAQVAQLLPNGMTQFIDPNGAPYAGGFVYTYVPGTTTPKATWLDPNETTLNANPIHLDSAGRAIIWASGEYRQVLQDLNGNTIWDQLTNAPNVFALTNTPANSILANPTNAVAPAQGVPVLAPLSLTTNGLGYQLVVGHDTSSPITVTSAFNATFRYASTTAIQYNLPTVASVGQGFAFSGFTSGNSATFNPSPGDQILGVAISTAYTIPANSNWTITALGGGLWSMSVQPGPNSTIQFVGQTVKLRGQTCPQGTLLENGQAISRTTYAALFAYLGTSWGVGDGSTTFNVPNAEGYFDRNWNPTGSGIDPSRVFASIQADKVGPLTINDSAIAAYFNTTSTTSFSGGGIPVNTGVTNGSPSITCSTCGTETRPQNITALSCIVSGL